MSDSLWLRGLQPTGFLCPWGFCRQEYWSGLPCSSPEDLPNPGIEPTSPVAPVSQEGSLPLSHRGSPLFMCIPSQNKHKDHSSFCYLKKKDLMKSRDLPSRTMKKHHIFHLNAGGSQGLLRSSVGGTHRGCHSWLTHLSSREVGGHPIPLVQGRSSGSSQERNVLGPAEPSWHPEEKLSTSARPPATSLGTLPSLPGAFPPPRPQYFRLPALAGTPNLQLPQSSVLWGKKEVWKHQKVANCLCYK